jgi:peptidoglycan/LPS O-acetylase OafA/YrhL
MLKLSFWGRTAVLALSCLLFLPALALAASGPLGFNPSIETWALLLGGISTLFMYVINYHAPWLSEQAKGIATLLVSGVIGAVYMAIETGNFGWNDATVSAILTAILGAFGAHALVFKPSGINTALGGGSNAGRVA